MAWMNSWTLRLLFGAVGVVIVCAATWILSSNDGMDVNIPTSNATIATNASPQTPLDGRNPHHDGRNPRHDRRKPHRETERRKSESFIIDGSDAAADSLMEIIGSVRYHHPNASVVVYTAKNTTTESIGNLIHAWGFIKHVSLQTIQSSYPTLPTEYVDLATIQSALHLFDIAIFIPNGHFVTSPVTRMMSSISRRGYAAEKSQDNSTASIYGYDKKSILYEQLRLAFKGCQKYCKETDLSIMHQARVLIKESAVSTIAIPIMRLDPKRSMTSRLFQ
eukprot:TRINITY_DN2266_c0_g1_i1.p2 TRINITY_DN2266_c0_g1~~TRINITY_DN2266_c0_g1_i1.p2  ORF type:complete len:277 (-),score=43.76 TRINITY_DN2266_c0_g1_i1:1423-2253(-)